MFKKDDKVKVIKGIKAFEGLTGTVLDTNGNQVKVRLNLSNDAELQKNLINVFEAYQLELESLDLLKEDNVSFDNDVEYPNPSFTTVVEDSWNHLAYDLGKDPVLLSDLVNDIQGNYEGYEDVSDTEIKEILHRGNWDYVDDLTDDYEPVQENLDLTAEELNEDYWKSTEDFKEYIDLCKKLGLNFRGEIEDYFKKNNVDNTAEARLEFLRKEVNRKNESLKLTEEELKAWCSDNDANYYTQDIKDDKVIIRGLNEDLAEYDFKTKELKVFDYSGTTTQEQDLEEDYDDNYIRDYVYDVDMLDEEEYPSWEFVSVIATSEDIPEDSVIEEAHNRGFKVFIIQAANYEKFVVAAEKITEEDIMEDFAAYLEGNPKVTEMI